MHRVPPVYTRGAYQSRTAEYAEESYFFFDFPQEVPITGW